MLRLSLRDQIRNEEIRKRARVTDIAQRVAKRWTDDIKRVAGRRWKQAAQVRGFWNSLQKTYVQKCTEIG
ncbi:jg17384 [Pararge aegeria aegeria]|uniref:Jg17384 protein n=1 Tax=Pararge aegeria aegeria TaxID=348720 RepID=A0A8S4S0X2_9NEOP|nr:jg17384 [Pararge aegeria aegeria]